MKKLSVVLLIGILSITVVSSAQEFYIGGGSSLVIDGAVNFHFAAPSIEFSYVKNVSPRLSWAISPVFVNYKMVEGEFNEWGYSSGNLIIPFQLRWQLGGKATAIGLQPYFGFNLYSTYTDPNGNATNLQHNGLFFGIPLVYLNLERGKFSINMSILDLRFGQFNLESFPMNPLIEDVEDHYDKKSAFVSIFAVNVGYRIK